jgi:hypothetical protein
VANRAYISVWTRDYGEATMLNQFQHLLATVPLSSKLTGFASLVVRAINESETPLIEQGFRGVAAGAADVIAVAREHAHADAAYEVEAYWDLWERDPASGRWQGVPELLLLTCYGEAYDDGVAAGTGCFVADVGFEHLFTGHAGLLGLHRAPNAPADPVEAEFLAVMTGEQKLREYCERTQSNIQQLMEWVRAIEHALPVERYHLWSEGEENLEARLDEILAVR